MLPTAFPLGFELFIPAEDAEVMAKRTRDHRRDIRTDVKPVQRIADGKTLFGNALRVLTHGGPGMMRLAEGLPHLIRIQDFTSVCFQIVPDLFFLFLPKFPDTGFACRYNLHFASFFAQ